MATPALLIRDLSFGYADGRVRWELPHLELAAGEQVLLTGSSGSGKSTLLNLIAGLRSPERGSVHVAGVEMTALHGAARDRARGQHIGVIFQTFNLLQGFTAHENVLMALMFGTLPAREHAARASELLQALGLTDVTRDVATMSIGQQQRVAVARALACKPALVLADEPTASLDPENASAALDLVQRACREAGAALLCTSHDPTIRAKFTRVESIDLFARTEGAAA